MKIYKGKETIKLPELDILTYLFDSPHTEAKEDTILHVEADSPDILYTKAQGRVHTKQLAHTLRHEFGIGAEEPGKDTVTVISSGQAYLPVVFYGVIAAGGVYSAASSAFTASEFARQVQDGDSRLIICSKDVLAIALAAASQSSIPSSRVVILSSSPAYRLTRASDLESGAHLVGTSQLDWSRPTDPETLSSRPVCLLYSSGTTGAPKGVPLSSTNLVSEAEIPHQMLLTYKTRRRAQGRLAFEYRTLAHLPAAHIAGVQGYFVNPLTAGGTVFWMPKFDFGKFLAHNAAFRVTFFFTVPPIYLLIAKSPLVKGQFRSLEFCVAGAAPMGAELQRQASAKLGDGGNVFIAQTWGLSETTGSTTLMPYAERDGTGSVSPLVANTALRIVGEDGGDVDEGMEGEVLLKGPMVFKGYHKRPEATRESFRDGWFCTGDIGLMKNDLLYIVDRKKELIKYKGLQVAPAELEALLISHHDVADAAVIGVEWQGTEVPRAYVVADKSKTSEQVIKDFVKENASAHKQLRGGVVFLDAIPKSPSGKILRKDLREMAKKETQAKL